jgi:hypothetical protein
VASADPARSQSEPRTTNLRESDESEWHGSNSALDEPIAGNRLVLRLSEALSGLTGPAALNLTEFLWTTTLFSFYNLCALRAATADPNLVTRTLARDGRVFWRNIPRSEFDSAVREVVHRLTMAGVPEALLRQVGISVAVAHSYYDYLLGESSCFIDLSIYCPFPLGCVLNVADRETRETYQVFDHATPASIGGSEVQSMCSHHNHVKGDNLMFDHKTLWNVIFQGPLNPLEK